MNIRAMMCCGVQEISGVSGYNGDYELGLKTMLQNGLPSCGALIFTQAGAERSTKYGKKFAGYIEENKLGTVEKTGGFINPNTKRPIFVYTWSLDRQALTEFYTKKVLEPAQEKAKKAAEALAKRQEAARAAGRNPNARSLYDYGY